MLQHVLYLDWYYNEALDLNLTYEQLVKRNPVCLSWRRTAKDRLESKRLMYGIAYKLWDLYRSCQPPLPLESGIGRFISLVGFCCSRAYLAQVLTMLPDKVPD